MERLRAFRKEQNLTQQEMARKLNITLSMYEKVEGGRANASANFMHKFKDAFPSANMENIFFGHHQQ